MAKKKKADGEKTKADQEQKTQKTGSKPSPKLLIPLIVTAVIMGAVILILTVPAIRTPLMGIGLSYKFVPDRTTEYDFSEKIKIETDTFNPDRKTKSKTKEVSLELKNSITETVEKVQGNAGIIKYSLKLERLPEKPETSEVVPPDVSTFSLMRSPTGKVVQKPAEGETADFKSILMETAFIEFPNSMLRPGGTWEKEKVITTNFKTLKEIKTKVNYTFVKLEKHEGTNCARIKFEGDLNPIFENSGSDNAIKGSGKISGYQLFDLEKGQPLSMEMNYTLNTEMTLKIYAFNSEKPTDIKINGKISSEVKMDRKKD